MFGKFSKPSEISKYVDDNRDLALKSAGINAEAERQFHQPHVLTEQEILLKSFRQPGETFQWAGITMMVSRFYSGAPWTPVAYLICDYVDKQGVIHEKKFSAEELPALIARNPEPREASKNTVASDNPHKVYEPIKKDDRLTRSYQ